MLLSMEVQKKTVVQKWKIFVVASHFKNNFLFLHIYYFPYSEGFWY